MALTMKETREGTCQETREGELGLGGEASLDPFLNSQP